MTMSGQSFRFMGGEAHPMEQKSDNPLDRAVLAYGASPLPGLFGLGQGLLSVWTGEKHGHRALMLASRIVDSAGIVWAYRKARNPDLARTDGTRPEVLFCAKRGLVPVEGISFRLAGFAYTAMSAMKGELTKFEGGTRAMVRYEVGDVEVWFEVNAEADRTYDWPGRPVAVVESHGRVVEMIRQRVWEHTGAAGVQIIAEYSDDSYWASRDYILTALDPPGDYVEDGGQTALDQMARRGNRFVSSGFGRKILLYGPPGTGKTTMAQRLAGKIGVGRVLRIDPVLLDGGQSAALELVKFLLPTVLLLDDMDRTPGGASGLLHPLERALPQLFVIGTANVVETLDPALLRPGRFDEVLRTDVPGEAYRREVIGFYCKKFGVRYRKGMVADMVGFAPADIREVLLTTGIVGADVYDAELERVKLQRGLYSEEKMAEFAMRKR